jgi:hypothetical protein
MKLRLCMMAFPLMALILPYTDAVVGILRRLYMAVLTMEVHRVRYMAVTPIKFLVRPRANLILLIDPAGFRGIIT